MSRYHETKSMRPYFQHATNKVEMVRIHIFVLSFLLRAYSWFLQVEVNAMSFRFANITFALFILLSWIHFVSQAIPLSHTLGYVPECSRSSVGGQSELRPKCLARKHVARPRKSSVLHLTHTAL